MTDFTFNFGPPPQQEAPQPGVFNFNFGPPQPVVQEAPQELPQEEQLDEVDAIRQRYGRDLTKEDFLKDPELMKLVDENLEARYKSGSLIGDVVVGASGGVWTRGWQDKTPEERFETWQNYHRSFMGGHTVTTANEVTYAATADDDTKAKLGKGYRLFDSMGNIFTGEGTWEETFDGVKDYMSAAIWDPTTVLGLGVGRLYSAGGAKAASQGVRLAMTTAYKTTLQKAITSGATKEAAKIVAREAATKVAKNGFMKIGAQKAAAYGAVDLAQSVGTDLAYQHVLIDTDAQEKYSAAQTGLAALGAVAIPAIYAGTKGIGALMKSSAAKGTIAEAYTKIKKLNGKEAIEGAVKQRIDTTKVGEDLASAFEKFQENMEGHLKWIDAKVEAGKYLDSQGKELGINEKTNLFWRSFLFGDTKNKDNGGFVGAMHKAGFVYVPRFDGDNPTNFLGDAISWLPDKYIKKVVDSYEKAMDVDLGFDKTAKGLSSTWKLNQSLSGAGLWNSSYLKNLLGQKYTESATIRDVAESLADSKAAEETVTQHAAYVLSVWKRLVTAHPATTGLNVKGWAMMSGANNVSDFVLGVLNLGEAGLKTMAGHSTAAKYAIQKGKGSILGAVRRGINILDPESTIDTAMDYLALKPDLYEKLSRELAGESGATNVLERYGLDPNFKLNQVVEKGITGLQHLYGVRLQDEVTKMLSFVSALDQGIRREYGQTFNEFMAREDAYVEMFSPRFKDRVDAKALDRTLRETASKAWSDKKGHFITLSLAKQVEAFSNNPYLGYAIPFGRWFNTSTAFLADYTMINAVGHVWSRLLRKNIDFAQEEGLELLAKGIVGLSTLGLMGHHAMDKIKDGLAHSQERRDDGSIENVTYDFPESAFRALGQAVGHKMLDGEVPEELKKEIVMTIGGQTFRAFDDGAKELFLFMETVLSGEAEESFKQGTDLIFSHLSKIVSGATRPLEPVNYAAMMATDDYEQLDRRQGIKFWNDSIRYVDHIFSGLSTSPERRANPTKGLQQQVDFGRIAGGVRSEMENTPFDKMLNSVGLASWKAVRWDGDPMVKNRMDMLFAPIVNAQAQEVLKKVPDFFDKPLDFREAQVSAILQSSRKRVESILDQQIGKDSTIKVLRELSQVKQTNLKRVMKSMGLTEDLPDIAAMPGGKEKLDTLLYLSKNYDKIFTNDVIGD